MYSQRALVPPGATARAVGKWRPRLGDRPPASGVIKRFPKRLIAGAGLADLFQRARDEAVRRRVSRLSCTRGFEHHYVRYETESDDFFFDTSLQKKEPRFLARSRAGASLPKLAETEETVAYFECFDSPVATGFGERRFYGNLLCARLTSLQLREFPISVCYKASVSWLRTLRCVRFCHPLVSRR